MSNDKYTAYRVVGGHWVDELHTGTLDDCKKVACDIMLTASKDEFTTILKD